MAKEEDDVSSPGDGFFEAEEADAASLGFEPAPGEDDDEK